MDELESKFRETLATFFNCEQEVFTDETNFIDDFGLDSFGVLMLIGLMQEKFKIEGAKTSEYYTLVTYKGALDFLRKHVV